MHEADHCVHFYNAEAFPLGAVAAYLGEALAAPAGCVAIVSADHRERLAECVQARGGDWARACARGQLLVLDATETAAEIAPDGRPDRARFERLIGGALERAANSNPGRSVRCYGEVVDLLWSAGAYEGAIELEKLWNGAADRGGLSLLCTVSIGALGRSASATPFLELCAQHSQLLPMRERSGSHGSPAADVALVCNASESELADFLENAAEGLQRVGPDGTVLWANKAQLELLGYEPGEYIGHCMASFHTDQQLVESLFEKLLRGETLYDQPARLLCKDGSVKHVQIRSNAFWENGRFIHTRCCIRDVTDRVRLDEEVQHHVRELAASNRNKDEFLAMLAHELRNPLAPIQTAASVARLRLARSQAVEHELDLIERQAEALRRLVDDLLDVSRITRGVIELRRVPTSLASIVSRAVDSTQHVMQLHRHTVHVSHAPEPIHVLADPVRLEQVLVNLLINAAKYTPPEGSIWVSVHGFAEHVELRVRDTGVGIEPEMIARVFDLFQQAERGLDRAQGGLGIGLTVARRLVELHGGSIEARSEGRGKGSEFIARLPRLAQDRCEPSPVLPASIAARESLRSLRILVVDDNEDAAEILCVLLHEGFGHETRMACDGPSALQLAAEFAPELILLDIGLPRMDGYAVARHLRAQGCPAQLVAVTGYGQERDRERTKACGFSDHLVKPVQLAALLRILEARSEAERGVLEQCAATPLAAGS